jgi:hypothetical protein
MEQWMWQQFLEVFRPPDSPVRPGSPEEWDAAAERFGRPFPEDYTALVRTYGEGFFAGFIYVCTPFALEPSVNFFHTDPEVRQMILDGAPEAPLYGLAEEGRLTAWARTVNADTLFWVAHGNPDEWKVFVADAKWQEWQGYGLAAVDFLRNLFQGRLRPTCFPDDLLAGDLVFSPREDWEEW